MKKQKNKFYSIKAKDESAELTIFDEIGFWGTTAEQFKSDWDSIKNKKNIKVLLNSPGGDVFDGITIYNIIASKRENVSVEVYGLAASAASIIALSGDELIMREGTFLMIHNPWGMAIGDKNDMDKMAEDLEKIGDEIANIYVNNSNLEYEEVLSMMNEETWLTAAEAMDYGFVSEIIEKEKVAACHSLDKYNYAHIPDEISVDDEPQKPETIRDFEAFLRDAGFSRKDAKSIASHGFQCEVEEVEEEQSDNGNNSVCRSILILTECNE